MPSLNYELFPVTAKQTATLIPVAFFESPLPRHFTGILCGGGAGFVVVLIIVLLSLLRPQQLQLQLQQ